MSDPDFVCFRCRAPIESAELTCCEGEGRAILASVSSEAVAEDPWIGALVDGRYQVIGRATAGGMARVYRALHTGLLQPVALKVLAASPDREPSMRRRFLREARLVASLRHPAVVSIQDYGVHERHPYLVMPFIDGGSLSAWVRAKEPGLGVRVAAIAELLRALDAAHRKGIVHRDVKPSNVLLERDGDATRVLLADFGLAVSSLSETSLSASDRWVGTPLYMAPEQIAPEIGPLGPRTDLYSAGCVAYALIAGRPPHIGDAVAVVFYGKTNRAPPPLESITQFALPSGLADVIERAVARDPSARWPSADAMREALLRFAAQEGERSSFPAPAPTPTERAPGAEPWLEAPPLGREVVAREVAQTAVAALAGPGALVVLAGAAGMGKTFFSRWLTRELASSGARTITVRCVRRSAPLQPIRAALLELLTLRGDASPAGLAKRLEELGPRAGIHRDAATQVLFPVLDAVPSAALARPAELARWLLAETSEQPLALFIEDAERADPQSVEVLGALVELLEVAPAPLLVVCAARTRAAGAIAGDHQDLARLRSDRVHRVEIGALDRAAVARVAHALAPGAPAVVADAVWRRSKGHPLLLTSLLRHLARQPADLAERPERVAGADGDELPPELLPVLLARVDDAAGADDNDRQRMHQLLSAVATLAVVPIPADVLDAYLDKLGWDPTVRDELLDRATEEELLADLGRADGEVLVFSHDLVRDALLASLKGRRRLGRKLHRAAAEVWAELDSRSPEVLGVVAHHLAHAGELAECADAFVRAARMAEVLGSRARAGELLDEGVTHLGDADGKLRPVRARLEIARAELALRAVELAEVRDHATRALADIESTHGTTMYEETLQALRLLARGGASAKEHEAVVAVLRSTGERLAREGRALDAARVLYEAGGVALGAKDDAGAEVLLRRAAELVSDRLDEDPAELDLFALLGALPSAIH